MQFPILSVLIFTPLAAGLILLLLPEEKKSWIKGIALAAGLIVLALSIWLYASYDIAQGGYQFQERVDWLPAFGISYYVGVDGISLPLLLMAGLVITSGVLVSWRVDDRAREFFAFLMFLAASVVGVFCSLDLFMLFFFFELAVFPKYLMIVIWGSPKTREYGGMKLTLYLFIGSHCDLDAAGRRRNESRRFCSIAGWHHAAPRRRALLGLAHFGPGDGQCGVWRVYRPDSKRFQICHRFFIRLAHGAGVDRFRHALA